MRILACPQGDSTLQGGRATRLSAKAEPSSNGAAAAGVPEGSQTRSSRDGYDEWDLGCGCEFTEPLDASLSGSHKGFKTIF